MPGFDKTGVAQIAPSWGAQIAPIFFRGHYWLYRSPVDHRDIKTSQGCSKRLLVVCRICRSCLFVIQFCLCGPIWVNLGLFMTFSGQFRAILAILKTVTIKNQDQPHWYDSDSLYLLVLLQSESPIDIWRPKASSMYYRQNLWFLLRGETWLDNLAS